MWGVTPEAWDRLAGRRFYSTSAWLSFSGGEPGADSGAAVRYVQGKLVAAVPVAELTAPPMPLYRWSDLLFSFGLPTLPSTGFLVGPRQGYQTHFLVSEGTPARGLLAVSSGFGDQVRVVSAWRVDEGMIVSLAA